MTSTPSNPDVAIAAQFVESRLASRALPDFPGVPPTGMAGAYAIQDIAIRFWPDEIAGWKVGRIPPALEDVVSAARLAGPIFARNIQDARAGSAPLPVIEGGFAAVEAEVVLRLDADAPPEKLAWTPEEALGLVGGLHIGVELAASPLATINDLGPTVVASDFGNNGGLVLGAEIPDGARRDPQSLRCATLINGQEVGKGLAGSLLGGPLGSLVFVLEHCAARRRPLRAGCLISTGQLTGIHDIRPGDEIRVSFGEFGFIECRGVSPAA